MQNDGFRRLLPGEEFRRPITLGFLLLLFITFTIVWLVPHVGTDFVKESARSLAEATAISLTVAFAVEPALRRKSVQEISNDLLWGLYNSDAPKEYQKILQKVAATKHYYNKATWRVTFTWEDPPRKHILRLQVKLEYDGISFDRRGFVPRAKRWATSSCGPYNSKILEWSICTKNPDGLEPKISYVGPQLEPYVHQEDDGSVYVNEAELCAHKGKPQKIPSRVPYHGIFKAEHYHYAVGQINLIFRLPVLRSEIFVDGDAANDLDVTLRYLPMRLHFLEGLPTHSHCWTGPSNTPFKIGLSLPGQMLVLSWIRRGRAKDI